MTMRTHSSYTCPNGHTGTRTVKENDSPYSKHWEEVDLEGMKESAKDKYHFSCTTCDEPMTQNKGRP